VSGFEHFVQSLRDILVTPVGSRVMRRAYGSVLPWLVDKPMDDRTILRVYVATAAAITRWEPRGELTRVLILSADQQGRIGLSLSGLYYPRGHLGDRSIVQPFSDVAVFF
jgi:uncharacterized protein